MDASRGSACVIVVPCYNEAERLCLPRFDEILHQQDDISFCFVDDGSTDATRSLLQQFALDWPERVRLIVLPVNRGKAEAVRVGMQTALEVAGESVGYWDADLATPLAALHEFRSILRQRDGIRLVMGARVVLLGRRIERKPLRHYLGRAAATLTSFVLGIAVYDTQCGAKLFRAGELTRSLFAEAFVSRWVFDIEILARMIQQRGGDRVALESEIVEVPLTAWSDIRGSKLRTFDYGRALVDLWKIRRSYLVPRR